MKIYPLLSKPNRWENWTNTYLDEINSKSFALFQYIKYFHPDFYEYDLPITEDSNHKKHVKIADLPLYGYYKVLESELYDDTTNRTLEAGTLIVSYARGESQINNFQLDNSQADIRNQEKYYTIQPFGWASYYLSNISNNQGFFTFDSYAQETYGLNYLVSWNISAKRYYIKRAAMESVINNINNQPKTIIINSNSGSNITDKQQWYVVNQNYNSPISSLWTDISINPLMCGFFYKPSEDTWTSEELAFDYQWRTSTKFVETNIAVYTIIKLSSSTWPNKNNLWLEVW